MINFYENEKYTLQLVDMENDNETIAKGSKLLNYVIF